MLLLLLAACADKPATGDSAVTSTDDSATPTDDSGTPTGDEVACADSELADADVCAAWMLDTDAAAVIATESADALVNVQSATVVSDDDGTTYVRVQSKDLPDYAVTLTQADIDAILSRPMADTDLREGGLLVAAGDTVQFGDDIGYDSTGCEGDEGYGYWPPGPECPEATTTDVMIPTTFTESASTCWTQGTVGVLVNGVSLNNWTDTFSYESSGTWYNVAQVLEVYDADVCVGHAGFGGAYHHHADPICLGEELADAGDAHSPIYGYAYDGVPIYGPWYAAGERAESCWKPRDYDRADSETGCGGGGARTCVLVDPTDPSLGTEPADTEGPNTADTVTSLSGNLFTAVSGTFFEDYWFDAACAAEGGAHLDAHNGHDHDGLGYHYHITESFPYTPGPTYYGELPTKSAVPCNDTWVPTPPM